jgi:hypothetical protein
VDSTIAAALISGGVGALGIAGTVITSVVGSRNSREATRTTVEAGTEANRKTLAAAREDAYWAKAAEAYEQTLTVLLHAQSKRRFELQDFPVLGGKLERMSAFYDSYQLPGKFETEARLAAYASDKVLEVQRAAQKANYQVRYCSEHLQRITAHLELKPNEDVPKSVDRAFKELDKAQKAADEAEDVLIRAIRQELRSRPGSMLRQPPRMFGEHISDPASIYWE